MLIFYFLHFQTKHEAPPSPVTLITHKTYVFLTLGVMVSIENFRTLTSSTHKLKGSKYHFIKIIIRYLDHLHHQKVLFFCVCIKYSYSPN